jgi:hypothetical protein
MGTNYSSASHNKKFAAHKKSMPIVRCVCGSEILVVPDLKTMNLAINNHVAEHKKASDGSKMILSLDSLEQFLTEQVLIVASKINLETANGRARGAHGKQESKVPERDEKL